uniref:HD-Zip IV transcription factor GL9H1 n=1 Tax=Triticum turgidum subsp. durum TaxID=4567 RepID=F8TTC6_TRITD|nr:HD-Zip IV transcription factor GL9H1 [Triticum turgidum subsp. durum]
MTGNRGGRRRKAGRRARDNDLDISQSNSDGQDGAEGSQQPKRRLQRLNPQQTQVLEGFFGICAHPDENQRMGMSESTGLTMQQVKFWFQNKRTHMKHVTGKEETYRMKAQNEMLREENKRLASAAKTAFCPACVALPGLNPSVEVQRLRQENESLKQQLSQLRAEAHPSSSRPFQLDPSTENIIGRENDMDAIAELAQSAMHEFVVLSESGGPLWMPVPGGSLDVLNKMAYAQTFGAGSSANAIGFMTEATRADGMVMMDAKQIVDYIMDSECYTSFCPGLVTSANTTKVYKWPTSAGYNGAMHLMTVETVFPSPLVPSRKCTFVRCCRDMQNGTVIIVDVSLDNGDGTFKCHKMPSGILIRSLNSDASQVTVVEHVQVNDTGVHELYRPSLSGLMFGARRWVSSIVRQSARMRDLFIVSKSASNGNTNGRKTLMKIADGLLADYASGIAAVPGSGWTILRGAGTEDDIRITYRKNNDDSNNAVVSVCASFHLPVPLKVTFDLLKNNLLRPKWDVLVNGNSVREEVAVCKGVGAGIDDVVSILHLKNRDNIMILQNSGYDVSGAFMVYCPVNIQVMNEIMSPSNTAESNNVSLYPTGFHLLPVEDTALGLGEGGATLVTAGFQIMLKLARGTGLYPRSASTAAGLMTENIATIKKTLTSSHPIFYRRQPPNNLI